MLELFNHTTDESETFQNIEEFIYWFNYTDKHSTIKLIKEV